MTRLSKVSSDAPEGYNKKECVAKRKELSRQLANYQHTMYAEGKKSVLVIFQGMDASGKDGATRKIFRYCSPTGVWAIPFKKPSDEEFDHDFLWRIHEHAPRKGHIQIFNRSHYEDVLIQRVHGWIDEEHVEKRLKAINDFEHLLQFDNQTTIIKFYMHLSRERQREKLQERIDNPSKNWKHNPRDWEEAKLWDQYMAAYEDVINKSIIPWHIVPADRRWYRDYFVAKTMIEIMSRFEMHLPTLETSAS